MWKTHKRTIVLTLAAYAALSIGGKSRKFIQCRRRILTDSPPDFAFSR